jgi:hypothetical protein
VRTTIAVVYFLTSLALANMVAAGIMVFGGGLDEGNQLGMICIDGLGVLCAVVFLVGALEIAKRLICWKGSNVQPK